MPDEKKKPIISKEARAVLVSGKVSAKKQEQKTQSIIEQRPMQFIPQRIETKKEMKKTQKINPIVVKGFIKKKEKGKIDEKVRKSLRYSTSEGMLNAAASSIHESYITPLALALKATNFEIGMLFTMRQLLNSIAQMPGAKLTQYFDRKRIWFVSQLLSKVIFWIPIIFLPLFPSNNAIILLIALFAVAGFFSALRSPAWSSLMGDLVPMKIRGSFFGKRNALTGFAGIVATLAAGFLLSYYGFPIIFIIAIVLAAASIPMFMKMYEPPLKKIYHYKHSISFNPKELANALKTNRSLVIFTVYIMFMYFAVEIASPFYAVYMLRDLNIGYVWFAAMTVIGAFARIISYKYWGRLNDKYGSRKILVICGIFACFTPLGWTLVSDVSSIALLKIFDGLVWSGFDTVIFNYLLDITPAGKRPQYVANHNVVTGIGVILGTAAGGLLAEMWASSSFTWLHGLQILFMTSFILRLLCLSFLPKISEVTIKQSDVPVSYVFWQAVAVEPARGLLNTISYTFRYPYEIEKKFRKEIDAIKYKIRLRQN